jgi:metal-responsive CopG/Arc/MetJ family transcriptional regulator
MMKTAISIDTEIYEKAEDAARQMGVSRSKIYSLAIAEYMQNHISERVTERLNQVYKNGDPGLDEDIKQAQYDLLAGEDW